MPHSPITDEDQRICAWFESQPESVLRDLEDRYNAVTPRQCWIAFCAYCPPPATQTAPASLPAPADAGQGVGTIHPERTGWDKMRDNRFVLAKGAGPGIWNRWITCVAGHRIFWSRVYRGYLA